MRLPALVVIAALAVLALSGFGSYNGLIGAENRIAGAIGLSHRPFFEADDGAAKVPPVKF